MLGLGYSFIRHAIMSAVVVQCLHHLLIRRRPHISAISTLSSHSLHPRRNFCTRRFASSVPFHSHKHSTSTQDNIVQHITNENDGEVMEAIDTNPPRGTRDFTPEDMRLRSWLFQNFREVNEDWGLNWDFIYVVVLFLSLFCLDVDVIIQRIGLFVFVFELR